MDTPTPPKPASFSHRAAQFSWVCPIITLVIFVVLIFNGPIGTRKITALIASVALSLVVVGLIFGIVALFGISKHGAKGILVPALVGILINGLLLSFVVMNFLTARARALQQHGGIERPTPALPLSSRFMEICGHGCVSSVRPVPNQALHRMTAQHC